MSARVLRNISFVTWTRNHAFPPQLARFSSDDSNRGLVRPASAFRLIAADIMGLNYKRLSSQLLNFILLNFLSTNMHTFDKSHARCPSLCFFFFFLCAEGTRIRVARLARAALIGRACINSRRKTNRRRMLIEMSGRQQKQSLSRRTTAHVNFSGATAAW